MASSFCAARVERRASPLPPPDPDRARVVATLGFSSEAVEIAEVIGALDAMEALVAAEGRPAVGVNFLLARQAVTDRVLLATLDVNASLAAIDCEGERGDSLRGQLQRVESRRARNLGLASILLGATTAALTGGLGLAGANSADDIVGIIGGAAEASLGGALLYNSTSGRLRTRNNLLGEIWRSPEQSTLFPPTVWRYLTRREAPDAPSIAEEIAAGWREAGLASDGDALFEAEGEFTVGDLERRDAMLDLLEARIALMSRDLRILLEEVVVRTPAAVRDQPRRVRAP
ncbi:hypothetical protein [Roseococcus sp. SYP-B2431]|uniref:hypothetical protein n=1 Tax=Roseococcus sp. SYP-B2431 TaxID=2496640 RepID=UPI0013F3A3C6|nr:hypothetical protein [Roseococcus sp. SYP-B2431]